MLLSKAETLPKMCWKSELWKIAACQQQPYYAFDRCLIKLKTLETQLLFFPALE